MRKNYLISTIVTVCFLSSPTMAQEAGFHAGPLFKFAKVATIDSDMPLPKDAKFRVAFDASKQGTQGSINKTINSVARFINMHMEAGVSQENIKGALVVHGSASFDLTENKFYGEKNNGAENANRDAIKQLIENGVEIYICGQSAAYHGIKKQDLLPGVKMALSAMTAHALLQQKGYTLNPF